MTVGDDPHEILPCSADSGLAEASKPEDWDEDAAYQIEDPEATKPDDWLDNEPEMIPDRKFN